MSGAVRQICVAVALVLLIGIQIAEASGRWDGSIQDSSDELSVVAMALCVGVAISVARTLVAHVRATYAASEAVPARIILPRTEPRPPRALILYLVSPPIPLRV